MKEKRKKHRLSGTILDCGTVPRGLIKIIGGILKSINWLKNASMSQE
jgi:hypothetical protein